MRQCGNDDRGDDRVAAREARRRGRLKCLVHIWAGDERPTCSETRTDKQGDAGREDEGPLVRVHLDDVEEEQQRYTERAHSYQGRDGSRKGKDDQEQDDDADRGPERNPRTVGEVREQGRHDRKAHHRLVREGRVRVQSLRAAETGMREMRATGAAVARVRHDHPTERAVRGRKDGERRRCPVVVGHVTARRERGRGRGSTRRVSRARSPCRIRGSRGRNRSRPP